jgi:hypothetical protein
VGSPAKYQGLPTAASYSAILLIVRERMEHLQFAEMLVLA